MTHKNHIKILSFLPILLILFAYSFWSNYITRHLDVILLVKLEKKKLVLANFFSFPYLVFL